MKVSLRRGGREYSITIERGESAGLYRVGIEGKRFEVEGSPVSPQMIHLRMDGKNYTVYHVLEGDNIHLCVKGENYTFDTSKKAKRRSGSEERGSGGAITPSMPGRVVKILVRQGEKVRKNQTLLILESMKMENELKAPGEGVIKGIFFNPGDMVNPGDILMEME